MADNLPSVSSPIKSDVQPSRDTERWRDVEQWQHHVWHSEYEFVYTTWIKQSCNVTWCHVTSRGCSRISESHEWHASRAALCFESILGTSTWRATDLTHYCKTCVREPPSRLTLNSGWCGKSCLSYKGTCHVILLAKLHDMYLYKTTTFPHQPVRSVSKVAALHRFYCNTWWLLFRCLDRSMSNLKACLLCFIIITLNRNSRFLRKQCRPWSDAAYRGVWSWSTLFANVTFMGR